MIETLLVLGASGDLTGRYLLPALAQLHDADLLPEGLAVVGVDRAEKSDDAFREEARKQLATHAPSLPRSAVDGVAARLRHRRADVTYADQLTSALDGTARPVAAYLALPNTIFLAAVRARRSRASRRPTSCGS